MLSKKQIVSIVEMRKKNMSNQDIAAKLNVNMSTVSRWMRRLREAGHDVPKLTGGRKIEL